MTPVDKTQIISTLEEWRLRLSEESTESRGILWTALKNFQWIYPFGMSKNCQQMAENDNFWWIRLSCFTYERFRCLEFGGENRAIGDVKSKHDANHQRNEQENVKVHHSTDLFHGWYDAFLVPFNMQVQLHDQRDHHHGEHGTGIKGHSVRFVTFANNNRTDETDRQVQWPGNRNPT